MLKKIIFIALIFKILVSCGFTPTLKVTEKTNDLNLINYEFVNTSYNSRNILRNLLTTVNQDEAKYLVKLKVIDSESAVNIESNGSVVEYRFEALIEYELFDALSNVLMHSSQTRGLANYDVSDSEYSNDLIKKEAEKTAVTEALQLMLITIQSKINM
ncbi:hypothetical protein OA527_04345 [Pelagibacteraceae bacterium]|nr:hypothetical protein [Pelagibacteraceae bacterium]